MIRAEGRLGSRGRFVGPAVAAFGIRVQCRGVPAGSEWGGSLGVSRAAKASNPNKRFQTSGLGLSNPEPKPSKNEIHKSLNPKPSTIKPQTSETERSGWLGTQHLCSSSPHSRGHSDSPGTERVTGCPAFTNTNAHRNPRRLS